jgi:hypothetical protein
MIYTAAIDVSTFIWCRNDYNNNKHHYYNLLSIIPSLFDEITVLKIPLLLRNELYNLIVDEFPYGMADEISYEFSYLTLSFLSDNRNWFTYSDCVDEGISSVPNIVKAHFSQNTQVETKHQICHLFNNGENPNHKFISFLYFYNHNKNLLLVKEKEQREVETFWYSSEAEINKFFDKYKIKFKHHTKHRREGYYDYDRKEQVSPFSCYHNQGELAAQELLDKAFFYEGHYYNFDLANNVFVRFIMTSAFVYHGHDLLDEGNNIPNQVKKKFNK